MNLTASFSVVTPTYNSATTIAAALSSVLAQTMAPAEMIVVDDHGEDDTLNIVENMRPSFEARGITLHCIRSPANRGPASARNAGMQGAVGSHIAFLDADDVWRDDKLAIVARHICTFDGDFLFHAYTELPQFNEPLLGHPKEPIRLGMTALLLRNRAQTSCVVIRRRPQVQFDEAMRYCEDYDLWLRMAEFGPALMLAGPALTRLGRPQLSRGGLSGNRTKMRFGEMRAYFKYCARCWWPRATLLPILLTLSVIKHGRSALRRHAPPAQQGT